MYGKVLGKILSGVMIKTTDEFIAIVTDASYDQTLAYTMAEELRNRSFFVDIHYITVKNDLIVDVVYNIQDIVLHSIPVVFLLLPSKIAEVVIRISENNFIRTKESTWITLNSEKLSSKYKCIQNIEMHNIMNTIPINSFVEDMW